MNDKPGRPIGIKVPLECRYSHGLLKKIDGLWSMPGVEMMKQPTILGIDELPVHNGQALVIEAWKCATCGYVELRDNE